MANKTQPSPLKIDDYYAQIADESRRDDVMKIADMMERLSGEAPVLWGTKLGSAIIGFGRYHYKYDSGREGDALRTGLASRAQSISVYIMPGYEDLSEELSRLGKHKMGKACLYIKRLSDVDFDVLTEIVRKGLAVMDERYPRA